MAKKESAVRSEIREMLVLFVDFIYALVFWQIVSEIYDKVLFVHPTSLNDVLIICGNMIPVAGVFYLLLWDWITGRILTVKNPYKGYTRFFLELGIAFCAYGAVMQIIKQQIFVFCWLAVMFLFGALWAYRAKREYPESLDKIEFLVVIRSHLIAAAIGMGLFFFFLHRSRWILTPVAIILEIVGGWLLVVIYEIEIPRGPDILGGAQMSFLSRKKARNVRDMWYNLIGKDTKSSKGDQHV